MKIGWIIGSENWAYKNVMEHFKKEMSEYEHIANDISADVVIAMSTGQSKKVKENGKLILRLDSKRALGL